MFEQKKDSTSLFLKSFAQNKDEANIMVNGSCQALESPSVEEFVGGLVFKLI